MENKKKKIEINIIIKLYINTQQLIYCYLMINNIFFHIKI